MLAQTHFSFTNQLRSHYGKVRDNYIVEKSKREKLISVATDRISVYNHKLKSLIPHKGEILHHLTYHNIGLCRDIIPTWIEDYIHPNVLVGKSLSMIPLEVIVRQTLLGSSYQSYQHAIQEFDGPEGDFLFLYGDNEIPAGLPKGYILPYTVVEFTRKSKEDEPITKEVILSEHIISKKQLDYITLVSDHLFSEASNEFHRHDVFLADTKLEFGLDEKGVITLADEWFTPDCSRLFIKGEQGTFTEPASKEIARECILQNNHCSSPAELKGLTYLEELTHSQVVILSSLYERVQECLTGQSYENENISPENVIIEEICSSVTQWLGKKYH